ncbi:hypothetical protein BOTBODRAFT_185115 [Botryobasidium botryosum FD-172 SS1]|uniref:Protein kinase domain-containing protein n=1 Tax=Botryobasidium botryosum (strain FD-172 SS1) TaxID=930990 RepID=A0A067MV12_BOTB1|nr:hypothetical protein BOTBODRAFT_185115 [Botryobasidium botryosum FD-172 SS1]
MSDTIDLNADTSSAAISGGYDSAGSPGPPLAFSGSSFACAALSAALGIGSSIANFSAVPGLAPGISALRQIWAAFENIKHNRTRCKRLRDRSAEIMKVIIRERCPDEGDDPSLEAQKLYDLLREIGSSMSVWAGFGYAKGFVYQVTIKQDVEDKLQRLDEAKEKFIIAAHLRTERYLRDIQGGMQVGAAERDAISRHQGVVIERLGVLQEDFRRQTGEEREKTRQQILHVQSVIGDDRLPNTELRGQLECKKVKEAPTFTTPCYEIWEGLWMGETKVALKALRFVTNDDVKRKRDRVNRQVRIWAELRSERIVRLYGVCSDDGKYPYMVMPWYDNGNAVQYLENKPASEHIRICLEAAYALQYLHTLPTPVVHGNLKGSNIMISDEGSALLSDFGLSVLAGDANSASFPTKYHLWMSLETLTGEQTIKSDIWAWAMTTLELVSGKEPFHRERHVTRHWQTISEGGRPKIEDHRSSAFDTYPGLWSLLESCWQKVAANRPPIQDVVQRMETIIGGKTQA